MRADRLTLGERAEQVIKERMRVALCKRMRRSHPDTYGKGDCDGRSVVCGWCGCAIDEQVDILTATLAILPPT
jgi:hypothetical protein